MTAGWCGHVAGARPPVVAMAAAGPSVVRRVEQLGDLAQAHIQHLSEAAGEDGEGAERAERAGGGCAELALRGRGGCGLRSACPARGQRSTPRSSPALKPRRWRRCRVFPNLGKKTRSQLRQVRAACLSLSRERRAKRAEFG